MAWMEGREYYRSFLVVFHIFGGQAPVGRFLLLSNVSSYCWIEVVHVFRIWRCDCSLPVHILSTQRGWTS